MSKYYAEVFTTWLEYSDWIRTTHDTVISIVSDSSNKILVTLERNRKLNEEL